MQSWQEGYVTHFARREICIWMCVLDNLVLHLRLELSKSEILFSH